MESRAFIVGLIVGVLATVTMDVVAVIALRLGIAGRGPRRTGPEGEEVQISISDTGEGIAPDKIKTIFERFSQLHNQDRRGIGLGLYIAKMMIEEHPGRIWVESKLGEGSTFHFTLPLRSGAIREAKPQ